MHWGCPWGGTWGEGGCVGCEPFVPEMNEPGVATFVPPLGVIGSIADVNYFAARVSQVPGLWFFGTTQTGVPTVGRC